MRALPLALALLVAGCAYGPVVHTDFDPAANFASYRTYQWLPVDVPRGMNPLMFRRVQGSIDRSLAARGYRQANPGDFAIAFTVDEKEHTEISSYGSYYPGWGWGWGGWGGWGYPSIDSYQVTERSIVVDIYDGRTHNAVWHGVVSKEGYPGHVDYSKLDATVDAMLSRFPPQPATVATGSGR